tara:strand:- start:349 stop:591 length:243 start_codon:yes stop_codon:yes gene_type:complete
MKMSNQQDRVLAYVRTYGSITSLEAIENYGITRLASTIHTMKTKGHVFEHEHEVKVPNRFGEDCRVTRYHYKGMENKENK